MDCHEIQRLIPFLDDGTLDPADEKSVHAHIARCPVCRSEYDTDVRLRSLIHTAYPPNGESLPAVDMQASVRKGIERRKQRHAARRFVYSAAAAVLIAITAFTGFIMNRSMVNQPEVVADTEGFYEYVADLYVTSYDLVVNAGDMISFETEEIVPEEVLGSAYVNVSMEDMITYIDSAELGNMIAMTSY